jgi:choline dehydrogenase-like flavoprotein
MINDACSVPDHRMLEADVCIVGTGPAGITLAREFIGRSMNVCLLESGGLESDPEIQSLGEGEVVGLSYSPLESTRARRLGGTSNLWNLDIGSGSLGVRLRRLDPDDFESRDWVPYSGWPFRMNELVSFYERAHVICLGPLADHPDGWPKEGSRHPFADSRVFEESLFLFGPRDLFTQTYQSEIERAENVSVHVNGTVTRLETDPTGQQVTGVRVATLAGGTFSVVANAYVLAAGGIENARLLLVSDSVHRRGIGNEHDVVGRFFMEHPHLRIGVIIPVDKQAIILVPEWGIRRLDGHLVETWLTLTRPVLQQEGLLNSALLLVPSMSDRHLRYQTVRRPTSPALTSVKALRSAIRQRRAPENVVRHIVNIVSGIDEIGLAAAARLRWNMAEGRRDLFGSGSFRLAEGFDVLAVDAMIEQAPNPESRVTLSDELDALGVPRVRLNWNLNPLDVRTQVRTQQLLQEAIERTGLGKAYPTRLPLRVHGGHHHMGTTRMHSDPRYGVVDENCRVHGVANLFVAGSSVFPTSGYANPTLTIVALAVRLADHLAGEIMDLPARKEATGASKVGGQPSAELPVRLIEPKQFEGTR